MASLPVVRFSLLERLEETEISDLTGRICLLRRPDCPSEARPSPGTRVTNTSNYISDLCLEKQHRFNYKKVKVPHFQVSFPRSLLVIKSPRNTIKWTKMDFQKRNKENIAFGLFYDVVYNLLVK